WRLRTLAPASLPKRKGKGRVLPAACTTHPPPRPLPPSGGGGKASAGESGRKGAAHAAQEVGHAALARHALHHLLHLRELLEQPVHVLDGRPGTCRDALLARAIDDLRAPAFRGRHGVDDGLE